MQDLVVIGGGAGGLNVASVASQLGLKVTLVEKNDKLGGDCLHTGCVPSKTFIHAAKIAHWMRQAEQVGLEAVECRADLSKVNAHVQSVIAHIQHHDDPERFRAYGCQVLFGAAKFVDKQTIQVNGEMIRAKRFVIATGSSAAIPPIEGLADIDFLTNETFFQQQQLPKRLVILGSGVIGLELGQAMARLGSQVTLIDMGKRLLPQLDTEISEKLQQALQDEALQFHFDTKVVRVTQDQNEKQIHCEDAQGKSLCIQADTVLVATGRQANVAGLNLDRAEVSYTPRGITVDARLRSTQRHIFAMGDVVDSPYKFTHIAEYHAGIVISNAVFRVPKKVDSRVFPAVIFTDPEVASVGISEQQAKEQGIKPTVLRYDFADADRALTDSQAFGLAKLVIHKGRILGAGIIAPHAGELIAEIALAMQTKQKIAAISATIHAYPTLSQANRRLVNSYYGDKLFSPMVKKVVAWINRWL